MKMGVSANIGELFITLEKQEMGDFAFILLLKTINSNRMIQISIYYYIIIIKISSDYPIFRTHNWAVLNLVTSAKT